MVMEYHDYSGYVSVLVCVHRSGDSSKASTVKSATANYSEDTFDSAPPSHAVSAKREVKTTDKPTHRAEPESDDLISMTGM
jgi:hypothetical protein